MYKKIFIVFVFTLIMVSILSPRHKENITADMPIAPKAAQVESSISRESTPKNGDEACIDSGGAYAWVAVTQEANNRLIKLCVAKDELGITEMLKSGQVMSVQAATLVRVIDFGFMTSEVRILEGKFVGRNGFLPTEHVVPISRRAKLKEKIDAQNRHEQDFLEAVIRVEESEKRKEEARQKAINQANKEKELAEKTAAATANARRIQEEIRQREIAQEQILKEDNEAKSSELLKHAKRWLNEENNKEIAIRRLEELLRRFPDSSNAVEARKMLTEINK